MENELIQYLSKHSPIDDAMQQAIRESSTIASFPKKAVLLQAGEFGNACYFILKGCIRSYYVVDGVERTADFFTEGQVASPPCYGKNVPSELFLECVEDTTAGIGTPESEALMYQKFPQLESVTRQVMEAILADYVAAFAKFKMSSPEERYQYVQDHRPELLQRVPQHQLASYLGITPESLSRIRRRSLAKKE